MHTRSGARDVTAGEAFYVEPGHVPEAIDDTEMFEVSPTAELHEVQEHLQHQLAQLRAAL